VIILVSDQGCGKTAENGAMPFDTLTFCRTDTLMTLPRWNDRNLKGGTMIRTALWLVSEIGEGNSFTKEQHRAAFSGIAQADRRLRDLRDHGWVIPGSGVKTVAGIYLGPC
jgi:hypothetical protein